jgi:hypothetical protein
MVFVDNDECETNMTITLLHRGSDEADIIYHNDKLWQDDDGWSMIVLVDQQDDNELSDVEIFEV